MNNRRAVETGTKGAKNARVTYCAVSGKVQYRTRRKVLRGNGANGRFAKHCDAYQCIHCGQWHVFTVKS